MKEAKQVMGLIALAAVLVALASFDAYLVESLRHSMPVTGAVAVAGVVTALVLGLGVVGLDAVER